MLYKMTIAALLGLITIQDVQKVQAMQIRDEDSSMVEVDE